MLYARCILCPFEPAEGSRSDDDPALVQSLYLADHLDAVLCVVPLPHRLHEEGASAEDSSAESAQPVETASPSQRLKVARQTAEALGVSAPIAAPDLPSPVSAADLLAFASANDVDLIVVDTPADRGPIPPLASDPVRSFVKDADVPVFIAEHAVDPSTFRRILVPTDLSRHAREALRHAQSLANLYGATINLLHVIERPQYVALNETDMLAFSDATVVERKTRRRIDAFLAETPGINPPEHIHLAHGEAADQIVDFACENPIDLVVLSTHGTVSRAHQSLGSVADKVLRRATCPLVLTRAYGRSLISAPSSDGALNPEMPSIRPRPQD